MSETYRNEYEIRIFGMRRSGNHMLANWVASLFDHPVYYFNNCPAFSDPFQTFTRRNLNPHISNLYCNIPILRCTKNRCNKDTSKLLHEIQQRHKECLLIGYEDIHLERLMEKSLIKNKQLTAGSSEKIFDIVLLRDVFNWAASRMHIAPKKEGEPSKIDRTFNRIDIKKWEALARDFLGETHYLKENKIPVSYNAFVSNVEYREHVARRLGKENRDWTITELGTMFASGSSFEKNTKMHNANEMKVFERWKVMKDNESYREMLNLEKDSIELSERIFGHIPGTECLLD